MTRPVPAASERGMLRRGCFTSPAVKVMLFQASEENREPTWATQKATNRPNAPPAAETLEMKDKSGLMGVTPRGVQRSVKLALTTSALRAKQQANEDEREQGQRLGGGEDVLDELADLQAARVDEGQQHDDENGGELLGREAHGVVGGEIDRRDDPGRRRDGRREDAEVAGERDGDGGDGAGLDDQEQRPAVEESPERAVGFAQIDVLAAGAGHHRGQFAVAQRGADGQSSR